MGSWAVALVACLAGLLQAFHPTLLSGFRRLQTDPMDPRFNGYILEHGYRWWRGDSLHSLWSPPFFHPSPNVLAYGDTLLGSAPLYWLLRGIGLAPDPAYQCWMIGLAGLNFAAAWLVLRRTLRHGLAAAAAGAFLFAFGSARVAQTGHAQLFPHVYTVGALWATWVLFAEAAPAARRRTVAVGVLAVCVPGQLWAGYYLGFFLVYGLVVGALWGAARSDTRGRMVAAARRDGLLCMGGAAVSLLLVAPLAWHAWSAAQEVGVRGVGHDAQYLPRPAAWFYMGTRSWLYGWTSELPLFDHARALEPEHTLGVGLVASATLAVWGWRRRHVPWVRVVVLVLLTTLVLYTWFPGRFRLWRLVYYGLPGAQGIRVMSRVALLLLVPAALALAWCVDALRARRDRWRWLGLPLALMCALEQGRTTASTPVELDRQRVAAVAARVDPAAAAFLYLPPPGAATHLRHHIDAMWASLLVGVPTVNGYSGNVPPDWPFFLQDVDPGTPADYPAALVTWAERMGIDPRRVQIVEHVGESTGRPGQ